MGQLTNAKPRPKAEPTATAAVDTAVDDTATADPNEITSYDTASIAKFMGMEPEVPPLPNTDTAADTEAEPVSPEDAQPGSGAGAHDGDAASPDTAETRSWYQRVFGAKDANGPEQMEAEAEMNDEMYAISAEAATNVTDATVPMLIGRMHDRPTEDFKANDNQKRDLSRAYELYLRWKKMRISPLQYLIFQIFIVYGVNFIMGVFSWVSRIGLYGWHMPWSESWKKRTVRSGQRPNPIQSMETPADYGHQQPQNAAMAQPAPPPPAPPKPQPVPTPHPVPEPQQAPKQAPQPNYKSCLETNKVFRAGEGYPQAKHKTAERFPEMVDKFIDRSAWMKYSNKHGLYGQGGKAGMHAKAETQEA